MTTTKWVHEMDADELRAAYDRLERELSVLESRARGGATRDSATRQRNLADQIAGHTAHMDVIATRITELEP